MFYLYGLGFILLAALCFAFIKRKHLYSSRFFKYVYSDKIISFLVLLVGVSVSLALFYGTISKEREQERLNFKLMAEESFSSLENRIIENSTTVGAIASFFNASSQVSRRDFAVFVRPFIKKNKSIQALQWIPRVMDKDRKAYEAAARLDGLSDFHFKEWNMPHVSKIAGIRKDYFVVYYNEPLEANKAVIGLDNGSEPVRRKSLLESAECGLETYSPPITLMQSKASQKGYLVYIPVYDRSIVPGTFQQKSRYLRGFATGSFIMDKVLKSAISQQDSGSIYLEIFDITSSKNKELLGSIGTQSASKTKLSYEKIYSFGNRNWLVHATPGEFYSMHLPVLAYIRLVFSLILTCLVFVFIVYRSIAIRMLRENEERLRDITKHNPNAIAVFDNDLNYLFVSDRYLKDYGLGDQNIIGRHYYEVFPEKPQRLRDVHQRCLLGAEESTEKDSFKRLDGSVDYYRWECRPWRHSDNSIGGIIAFFEMITERKRNESQIRLHSAAINAANDLIVILNLDGKIVFANDAFERQTGYGTNEIIGQKLSELWQQNPERRSGQDVWAAIGSGLAWSGEMPCRTKNGSSYTADVTITPLPDEEDHSEHMIVIARNITERKEYEGQLDYQAHHDALTNLPNRLHFSEELDSAVFEHRRKHKKCGVLFIDLDKFKLVNDTMGHQAGDALLIETAVRLKSCLRDGDTLARMGGDEFTVLLNDLKSADDAASIAQRMLEKVAKPFEIDGNKLVIGASIGISTYPDNSTDMDGLLNTADAAMYKAKELGRNNYQFFSDELSQANLIRIEMERDLRTAVEQDELEVYYQPIVDLKTMKIAGAEALMRWNHPENGMISPGLFIPISEETGLINQMGKKVLEIACKQCKSWHEMGYTDFEISVNVSSVQLGNFGFIAEVQEILSDADLSQQHLILEVTESVLAQNENDEVDVLSILKCLGVRICLDDFGIGYSSLSRLKNLPTAHMKVDGLFTNNIDYSPKDKAMTESIILMAHKLGIRVTAEWIEAEEQLATIKSLDCDYAQGYLISPALPAKEFEKFIREWANTSKEIDAA